MTPTNIKAGLTSRQIERQKVREGGKYSKYPRCELCGKMVVSGEHWSDSRCNATGVGLILHKRCCHKSEQMNNKEFMKTFGKGFDLEQKKKYLTRLNKEFPDRE
jgi:hypothetical protein